MLTVTNPSSLEPITQIPVDNAESVEQKLTKAAALFGNKSRWLPLHERITLLKALHQKLEPEVDALAQGIAAEGGKPYRDAKVEAQRALAGIELAIHALAESQGDIVPLGMAAASSGLRGQTRPFPIGPVLAFSAFNHPLNLIVHQIIPAFAAGCPSLVKPAPDTPLSCLRLVSAMHEVGIPEDYVQSIITDDLAIAGQLVEDSRIAFFTFIGSAKVGWMLRGKLAPGVRCALEHGGVAPGFVCESADLTAAAKAFCKGGLYHSGQVCVSTQRLYVHDSVFDQFCEQLVPLVEALKTGSAEEAGTDCGPLIRCAEVDRVEAWVDQAVQEGAKCVTGGKRLADNYFAPTILVEPAATSRVSTDEIFGPVICLYRFSDLKECINQSNDSPFAFQAAIFTERRDEVELFYQHVEAATAIVNNHTSFRDDVMPFAGLKQSGLGVGGIPYTLHDMQVQKLLVQPGV